MKVKISEQKLFNIIKESIVNNLNNAANYDIDAIYGGELGNRSQYPPTDDADAIYAYDTPGDLSMAAQSDFEPYSKWGQNDKFASMLETRVKHIVHNMLKEANDAQNADSIDKADKCYGWNNKSNTKQNKKETDRFSRDYMIHGEHK